MNDYDIRQFQRPLEGDFKIVANKMPQNFRALRDIYQPWHVYKRKDGEWKLFLQNQSQGSLGHLIRTQNLWRYEGSGIYDGCYRQRQNTEWKIEK